MKGVTDQAQEIGEVRLALDTRNIPRARAAGLTLVEVSCKLMLSVVIARPKSEVKVGEWSLFNNIALVLRLSKPAKV